MELIHPLLVKLHVLHELVHGLLLGLLVQGMELPRQLDEPKMQVILLIQFILLYITD